MKVAVIGSGVSGLAATWLLNEYSEHEVHLYEKDARAGGHANTVHFFPPAKYPQDRIAVDAGFIVVTPSTYPNFFRFLQLQRSAGLNLTSTEMTLSVSRDQGSFEWAGESLSTIFCQSKRVLDPNMWRMLYDIARFNVTARALVHKWHNSGQEGLAQEHEDHLSIGEYLDKEGYSGSFCENYFIPMIAAIWITPPDTCAMDFPARTFIQFLYNHQLLQITRKPKWVTIKGGSHEYVKIILSKLPSSCLHLSCPVIAVGNTDDGKVRLQLSDKTEEVFDRVIMASHSNQALDLLRAAGGATPAEERILSKFRWSENETILHSDAELMPVNRKAWTCWNYLTYSSIDREGRRRANTDRVSLTYGINALQRIPMASTGPIFVTINPPFPPDPLLTQGRYEYSHPILDHAAVKAQQEMHEVQSKRGISFAGAWMNFGFHEDGFTAGMLAALDIGGDVKVPFDIELMEGSSWQKPASIRVRSVRGLTWGDTYIAKTFSMLFWIFEMTGVRRGLGSVLEIFVKGLSLLFGV